MLSRLKGLSHRKRPDKLDDPVPRLAPLQPATKQGTCCMNCRLANARVCSGPLQQWASLRSISKSRKLPAAVGTRAAVTCSCIKPSFAIRSAAPRDLQRLVQIEQLCCQQAGTHWSSAQLQEELDRPMAHVLVAQLAGDPENIAGFTIGWLIAGELQVLHVAVDPGFQGRGLGVALVQQLLRLCRCDADAEATLEVHASNSSALRLYLKLGFQEVGRRRRYYADGSDAVLMTRLPGPLSAARLSASSE